MLMTDLRHDHIRTKVMSLTKESLDELRSILKDMMTAAHKQLEEEGVQRSAVRFEATFDVRYLGQEHAVRTPVPLEGSNSSVLDVVSRRFRDLHMKQYTFTLNDPLEVVNVHLSAFGRVPKPRMKPWKAAKKSTPRARRAAMGRSGFTRVKVYDRDGTAVGTTLTGPAIVEEPTSTTVVQTGDRLKVDRFGNLIIEVARSG
jgi:N-methylhydantoinase A